MTDPTNQTDQANQGGAAPAEKPKKNRRIFLWFFLAVQLLFIIWIIGGLASSSGDATDCGSLDQETCNAAADVGAGIGVFLIVVFWFFVDAFLGIIYGVYRLAKR